MLTKFRVFFNENEFLETSSDLDDSEISLFVEEKRNLSTATKTKSDLDVWKRWCESLKKQGPLKSGNGTHLFSGAVFDNCKIVFGQKSPPLSLPKRRRVVIDSDEDD